MTNDQDIRVAKSIVDYIFRWFGKRFLTVEQQEEAGILSAEVKAILAERYANGGESAAPAAVPAETPPPGQTALFNSWEDAVECARCGGRMVRTGLLLVVVGCAHRRDRISCAGRPQRSWQLSFEGRGTRPSKVPASPLTREPETSQALTQR
jgi:hypothetical protein